MWVISGYFIPCSRLLFAFVCAAVASFGVCSDSTGEENGQKQDLVPPISKNSGQNLSPSTGLLLPELDIVASSIFHRQSNPLLFTEGNSGSGQNSPDNRQYHGHEMKPASDIFTGLSQPSLEGLQSRVNHQQKPNSDAHNGGFFRPSASHSTTKTGIPISHPIIIRVPSNTETYHQNSNLPQLQKSYNEDKGMNQGFSSTSDYLPEAKSALDTGLSFKLNRFQSSLPHSGGFYSSRKEINEFSDGSGGIPSGNFYILSQPSSVSNDLDSSVLANDLSPEKSSIKDSSPGSFSKKKPNFLRVQLNLLKDSQALKTSKAQENAFNEPLDVRNPEYLGKLSAQTMKHFNPIPFDLNSANNVENPGPFTKSIHGFKGLESSRWRSFKENSEQIVKSFERSNYKTKRNGLKSLYPSLLSQRRTLLNSATPTTTSSIASPELQTKIPKPSAPIQIHSTLLESGATNSQSNKQVYQHKVFQSPQFHNFEVERGEGLDLGMSEMVQHGLKFPQSDRIDQPDIKSTENEVKDLLMSAGDTEKFLARKYMNYPLDNEIGDTSTKIHSDFVEGNPTKMSETSIVNSAPLRPTGDLDMDLQLQTPGKTRLPEVKGAFALNSLTSSTVRGKPVMGNAKKSYQWATSSSSFGSPVIRRVLENPLTDIKAIADANIGGSASFSRDRPTMQMLTEDDEENETAATGQKTKINS